MRPVTYGAVAHVYGDYAADGRIGFAALSPAGKDLRVDLYVTGPGGGSARVVASGELAESLRLSPDGKLAVYVRLGDESSAGRAGGAGEELVLLPLEPAEGQAAEPRPIGRGRHPTFSPDGQWVVYSAPSQGSWRLRRVRVDGSARFPVGRKGIRDEKWPAISPDGRFVAYVGESGGVDRLFIRRFDGSGDRILLDEGAVAQPIW
jgi:Tol biopolymer transport system component